MKKMPIAIKAAIISACIGGVFVIVASFIGKFPSQNIQQHTEGENSDQITTAGSNSPINIDNSKKEINPTMLNSPNSVQLHIEEMSGEININLPPRSRKLTTRSKTQLLDIINQYPGKGIKIKTILEDQEAIAYATSIKEFLESEKHEVVGFERSIFGKPVKGQTVYPDGETIEIIIGSK